MKKNWALRTNDEDLVLHRNLIQALGYKVHRITLDAKAQSSGFEYLGTNNKWALEEVQRCTGAGLTKFNDIKSFLTFYFEKEKTEAEKDLDKLNQQLVELQAQIEVVKQTVNN